MRSRVIFAGFHALSISPNSSSCKRVKERKIKVIQICANFDFEMLEFNHLMSFVTCHISSCLSLRWRTWKNRRRRKPNRESSPFQCRFLRGLGYCSRLLLVSIYYNRSVFPCIYSFRFPHISLLTKKKLNEDWRVGVMREYAGVCNEI